jgi:hypothetical protein
VSKTPASNDGSEKRRSTRLTLALPIKVRGFDALKEPFAELTRTVMVSCHGCKYLARNYVPKGSDVTLEIQRGILHVGLNLEVPGNVWEIPMPPEDWFPPPGEEMFAIEEPPLPVTAPAAPPPAPVTLTAAWDASEILLMASRAEGREAELSAALQMAKTESAIAVDQEKRRPEPEIIPYNTSKELQERMEEALKVSIERLSESAVQRIVERASQEMAEIVEGARRVYQAAAEDLDTRIHKAVRDALYAENGNRHNRGRRHR